MTERTFDFAARADELRCHTTEWLLARREELVREQRRLHVEELAVVAVLDDRGALDDSVAAADGVSTRSVREMVETARALESLPELAAAAYAGRLSDAQLGPVTRLAEAATDAAWAERAPNWAPADLQREVRSLTTPTAEDGRARRAARSLGFWWNQQSGMLDGRFSLPDVDGALVESVLNSMVDRMRPPKGQPWETRARRTADALVELCRDHAEGTKGEAAGTPSVHMVIQVPVHGPAELCGVPLPDAWVESLRAQANVELVLVDEDRQPLATSRTRSVLSPKTIRAVRLRDGKCRWPGCDRRTGLQIHHLIPRSWGGSDERVNLARVCVGGGSDHHAQLAPQGPYILLGNPNRPDGLRLIRTDQLNDVAALAERAGVDELATHDSRAGPAAA